MENKGLQIDSKIAYEITLERLMLKEKEIIELRALCQQLIGEINELQHMLEDARQGN